MSAIRVFILAWLASAAILGGEEWSPPGGFRHALERKHAIAGKLRLTEPAEAAVARKPRSRAKPRAHPKPHLRARPKNTAARAHP